MTLNKDLIDKANEQTRPASRPGDASNDIIQDGADQSFVDPDDKEKEVKEKSQKKGLKI